MKKTKKQKDAAFIAKIKTVGVSIPAAKCKPSCPVCQGHALKLVGAALLFAREHPEAISPDTQSFAA